MICISRTLKAVPFVAPYVRSGAMETALTRIANRCTHGSRTLKIPAFQNKLVKVSHLEMHTETHPVASRQSDAVEMNLYAQVSKHPDVGRCFPEIPLPI